MRDIDIIINFGKVNSELFLFNRVNDMYVKALD